MWPSLRRRHASSELGELFPLAAALLKAIERFSKAEQRAILPDPNLLRRE
jgi:hypothetical protein